LITLSTVERISMIFLNIVFKSAEIIS
jgi:hypothetical protein